MTESAKDSGHYPQNQGVFAGTSYIDCFFMAV